MLGTGMPSPNPYRSGPSYALIINDSPYLIDAGEGIWRSIAKAALINGDEFTQGLSPHKLKYLFLTHLHQDHTVGIPSLLLSPLNWIFRIQQEIYGPRGTEEMVNVTMSFRFDWAEYAGAPQTDGAKLTPIMNTGMDQDGTIGDYQKEFSPGGGVTL